MHRKSRKLWLLAPLLIGAVLLWLGSRPATLPPLDTAIPASPAAAPPADMTLVHLQTGVVHRNAAFAYRGGSFGDKRDFAVSAVLVRHPRGDLLIDIGFSRTVDRQFALMPWWFRAVTHYTRLPSAAERLERAGYDRARLKAIVLTHAHWDHASALAEFPGTPVWITQAEQKFIAADSFDAHVAHEIPNVRYETLKFASTPYLGFPASYDVYGDGSIVIVPVPGHTPGSITVFCVLPSGKRYAFIGDLAWQIEGIRLRAERPWFTRMTADWNPEQVRQQLRHMSAIQSAYPDLIVVPAHDQRAYATLNSAQTGQ